MFRFLVVFAHVAAIRKHINLIIFQAEYARTPATIRTPADFDLFVAMLTLPSLTFKMIADYLETQTDDDDCEPSTQQTPRQLQTFHMTLTTDRQRSDSESEDNSTSV